MDLDGRNAVVTGAGSGIGRSIAGALAAAGMQVVLADVDLAAAERAAVDIGPAASAARVDVSDPDDVARLAETARQRVGAVHLLCNNAGIDGYRGGPLWEATPEDWRAVMDVNFFGVVNGIRAFLPGMLAHGEPGHVVNTVSNSAFVKSISLYSTTKHALMGLTEALDTQLRARNAPIGVTALCPGRTRTEFFSHDSADEAGRPERQLRQANLVRYGKDPDRVAERLVAGIRDNTLYLITEDATDDDIRRRFAEILP